MISCLLSGVEPIRRAQRRELPGDRAVNIARDPTAWAWLPREQNSWRMIRPSVRYPTFDNRGRPEAAGTFHAANGFPRDHQSQREFEMDWNRVEGNWKQVKGKVKEKWGNLTDDDLTAINGQRDQLEGKI